MHPPGSQLLDPVPRGGKRPLVPQVAGSQVCRVKVLAQGGTTNPMVLRHRATNPASLKIQLGSLLGNSIFTENPITRHFILVSIFVGKDVSNDSESIKNEFLARFYVGVGPMGCL